VKTNENQQLTGWDLVTLLSLIVLTLVSYGSYSRHIFSSENISSDQIKAEILAYQAAQIFLLRNVEKKTSQSRNIASESSSSVVTLGEDASGKPYKFQVVQDGRDNYRVLLSNETESANDGLKSDVEIKIDLSKSPEIEPAT
tara:strand:+ start:132043 stop:132468 length:426 start_codon:yes stop_codon:yes gene_type:complete